MATVPIVRRVDIWRKHQLAARKKHVDLNLRGCRRYRWRNMIRIHMAIRAMSFESALQALKEGQRSVPQYPCVWSQFIRPVVYIFSGDGRSAFYAGCTWLIFDMNIRRFGTYPFSTTTCWSNESPIVCGAQKRRLGSQLAVLVNSLACRTHPMVSPAPSQLFNASRLDT